MSNTNSISQLYVDVVAYPDDNTFVAECLELPIIVEAETVEKITEKMNLAIQGFFETFPEQSKVLLSKTKIVLPDNSEIKSKQERVYLKIPVSITHS
jgi:predicted RNase H-like HicB family nuclease